ncbi:MAG: arginase family protein [Desulfobacteraceae bacterium]|nr:arginase family protein [Desulfobacteraceae bacterium]
MFDPSLMPASGTPELDGLGWRQVDQLFARLTVERNIVAIDFSELVPIRTMNHPQYLIARLTYGLIGRRFPEVSDPEGTV